MTPEKEKLYVLFAILFVIEHDAWRGYHDMYIHSHSGFTLKIINSMNKDKEKESTTRDTTYGHLPNQEVTPANRVQPQ